MNFFRLGDVGCSCQAIAGFRTFLGGLKSATAKLRITSLNSHFPPPESSAQDVEEKKAELKTPHSKSLNLDIVAGPK
jgi:hypothetical protein